MKTFICLFIIFTSVSKATNETPRRTIAQEAKVLVEDSVRKIIPQAGSVDKIIFNKHAGIYYLKTDSKHYESIKTALINSQKSGESVQVKADSTTLEIEEIILGTK